MRNLKSRFSIVILMLSILICVGGGWITGIITNSGINEWYPQLVKSSLTPPNIVFPITWTVLYFLMAISLYLVWSSPEKNKRVALIFFATQLFFNFLWSFLFFYWKSPGIALLDIILLWAFILLTMSAFVKISKTSFYLLIPYFLWVSFAFYLNYFIWTHNA